MLVQQDRKLHFSMKKMMNIFFEYLLMIVLMPNYHHILIKHIHLLVKKTTKLTNSFFFNILEKARQNNGRVFIHCLGL